MENKEHDGFVTLVRKADVEYVQPIHMKQLGEIDNKDNIVPIMNSKGMFVKLEGAVEVPVVKIFNPVSDQVMYLSWTPEIEHYVGVPLVLIEEQRAELEVLNETLDGMIAKNDDTYDKVGSLRLELSKYRATPIWKLALGRIMVKLGVYND